MKTNFSVRATVAFALLSIHLGEKFSAGRRFEFQYWSLILSSTVVPSSSFSVLELYVRCCRSRRDQCRSANKWEWIWGVLSNLFWCYSGSTEAKDALVEHWTTRLKQPTSSRGKVRCYWTCDLLIIKGSLINIWSRIIPPDTVHPTLAAVERFAISSTPSRSRIKWKSDIAPVLEHLHNPMKEALARLSKKEAISNGLFKSSIPMW